MRVFLVCLVVGSGSGCGSAPRSGTAPHAGAGASAAVGVRADRPPLAVRQLERSTSVAPEPVPYAPALQVQPYQGDDIDDQIAMRERLVAADGDSLDRVEQLVEIANLYIQKGQTNRAERAYILAANETGFSKYKRGDEVLFRSAMLLSNRGELPQARTFFHKLIKDYPSSTWIADSYLQFGDYFFAQGDSDKAAKFYEKATQIAEQRTSGYAHYKLAWSLFRQGKHQDALRYFIATTQQNFTRDDDLHRAALRGFVYAYPDIGRPDRAYQALQRLDADAAPGLFARLGEVYAARGMDEQSAQVFEALAELVDRGAAQGIEVSEALSARARAQLADGHAADAAKYVERFADAADAGEMAYYVADAAWRRAAQAQDIGVAADLWERAAALFERAVDLGGLTPVQIVDAEASATVARGNARVLHSAANK